MSAALSDLLARLECKLNHFQSAIQTSEARMATFATVEQDIDAAKGLNALCMIMMARTTRTFLIPACQ